MAKQNSTPIIILGIIIVVLILNPGGITERLTERFTTYETIILETEEGECSLSLSKYLVEPGELVRGTIINGIFADCDIYIRFDGGTWENVGTYQTDDTGEFSYETTAPLVTGTYEILAICTDAQGSCKTNTEILTVAGGRCTETDGGNVITVPGITTFDGLGYMDACLPIDDRMIHEYWCEDDILHEGNFMCDAGSTCFATRSGAYCLAPTEWNIGDIVSDVSDSGTMPESGGIGYEFHDLTDFEVVPGGARRLGAKIDTNWDYVDQEACYGFVIQEGMEWMFMDSDSVEWSVVDNVPQAHSVDLCPLDWDGTNLWFLEFWKTQNIPGCDITYEWSVEIYVCE